MLSELADCHYQSGDYESAAGTYFLLSSRSPDKVLYKIRLMQTYARLKAWQQSIQAGQDALQPINESVVEKAANVLISAEAYDEAISLMESFLAEDSDNTLVAPLQGVSYYRKGDYKTAERIFQRQEDIGNDSYPIHYYLGQSYWQTKVMYRAEEELLAAWQIDSSDANLAYHSSGMKSIFR